MFDWRHIDTILLDMDGTVLDLAYDNYFWRELVPRYAARRRRLAAAQLREDIYALYADKQGTLDWYCLDYWSDALKLDLRSLKGVCSQRIRFLPGARRFLRAARSSGRRLVLVTNAHGATLEIKRDVAGLDRYFDCMLSSHEFGQAKEHAGFWPALRERLGFEPRSTALVDDSLSVLDAARAFGIGAPIAVRCPDSRRGEQPAGSHASVRGLGDASLSGLVGLR